MTDALRFERTVLPPPDPRLVELQPIANGCIARWIAVGDDGRFYDWELGREARPLAARVPDEIDIARPLMLRVSADARLAAIANRRGVIGAVIEIATGRIVVQLARDDYHSEHSDYPLAFVARGDRDVLVHGPRWNRLDAIDAWTGELLTARDTPDDSLEPHGLDYFHGGLVVSPSGERIAEHGWIWQPTGVVTAWSLARWLDDNAWESEDGPSRRELVWRDDRWDDPLVWLDDDRLATWGRRFEGDDDAPPAIDIFDARDGRALVSLPCASCDRMFHDRYLFSIVENPASTIVWDVARGIALVAAPDLRPTHYHPTAKLFLDHAFPPIAIRACGHYLDAPWATPRVRDVARAIDPDHLADELQILGDALTVAGCTDDELLAHCRAPGPHAGRCWALDRLH